MNQQASPPEASATQRFFQRVFKQAAAVEPSEFPYVIIAFFLFFCVLGGYFAVRPVRETMGTILGRERVSDLYVVTWITSLAIIPVYGALCSRFARAAFLPWIYGFIAIALAAIAIVFQMRPDSIGLAQFYYVMISVLNLFVISVFWSFLLEIFQPGQTKRLFPAIAAGGTAGALVGPLLTDILVGSIGNTGILFFGASLFVVAILLQRRLFALWRSNNSAAALRVVDQPMGGNPFAGVLLILKSPYLLGISTFVILLATMSTLLYLEQVDIVAATFSDNNDRTRFFSRLDWIVQSLTIVSQIVITGRVAKKWGVIPLVTLVPILMIGGFLLLASVHTLAVLAVVIVARRAGEYAFVRPGREMLFGGVDLQTKYKAKNTIDVVVYRGGDAVSAQVDAAAKRGGLTPESIAMAGAGLAVVWAINGLFIGRQREKLDEKRAAEGAA